MEIKYYSYDEEIIKDIDPGKIHIFSKPIDKSLGKKVYFEELEKEGENYNIFLKQPKFMGIGEFKTNLFLSDEIILREEKQVIAFYKSLSEKNRKALGVEGYYDVIDIAANFLNFFKLIKEYRLEELNNLKKWQEKVYNLFIEIEKDYKEFLKKKKFSDPTFILEEKNYTSESLEGYKEIIIYNHLFFTPLEKWLIKKLEKDGFLITLKVQLKEGDFCEEELQLKEVTLSPQGEIPLKEIEVYTMDDEFVELLKILELKNKFDSKEEKYEIFDANYEKYRYNNYFKTKKYLSELPMYSFLEGIYNIFSKLEVIDGELALDLHSVVEAIQIKSIKRRYEITSIQLEKFKNIIGEGYKYLTKTEILNRKELGEESFIFRIYEHMNGLKNYNTLEDWIKELSYSNEVLLELLNDSSSIEKYFEALSEIEVIESLNLVEDWNGFFGTQREKIMNEVKKSEGLLKLILKYLKFKEIESSKENKINKKELEKLETSKEKNRIFMNMSDVYIPTKKDNTFLFTEQQKIELGIGGLEKIRLEEKYNLIRGIVTSENVVILAVKNMNKNTSLSPFVEEILEKYNIQSIHLKQNTENYIELIKTQTVEEEKEIIEIKKEKPDVMKFEIKDLKNPLSLSAYMCDELFNCQYKMYMRYIERLENEEWEVDKTLTRREYGILAHELFEDVLSRLEFEKDYSPFVEGEINTDIIMGILENFIRKRKLKLPMLNEKYYKEIIYKNLVDSVGIFFYKMSKELKGDKIKKLIVEKKLGMDLLDEKITIRGNAKADLIIETEKASYIIDFKTGKLKERQLDFYSILYNEDASESKKYIFNVDKGLLEESKKIKMNKEDLVKELSEWLKEKKYNRKKSSICGRCEYVDLCRVGEIEDEE